MNLGFEREPGSCEPSSSRLKTPYLKLGWAEQPRPWQGRAWDPIHDQLTPKTAAAPGTDVLDGFM
jgi:hypothetical protein